MVPTQEQQQAGHEVRQQQQMKDDDVCSLEMLLEELDDPLQGLDDAWSSIHEDLQHAKVYRKRKQSTCEDDYFPRDSMDKLKKVKPEVEQSIQRSKDIYRQVHESMQNGNEAEHFRRIQGLPDVSTTEFHSLDLDPVLLQEESCSTQEGLMQQAEQAQQILKAKLCPGYPDHIKWTPKDKATGSSGTLEEPPLEWIDRAYDPGAKSGSRCKAKVDYKYHEDGGFRCILDAARLGIQFTSCDRMLAGKAHVESLFKVLQVMNRMQSNEGLMRDITMKIEVELPNGQTHICELQLQHLKYVKAKRQAHAHIKTTRDMINDLGLFPHSPTKSTVATAAAAAVISPLVKGAQTHNDTLRLATHSPTQTHGRSLTHTRHGGLHSNTTTTISPTASSKNKRVDTRRQWTAREDSQLKAAVVQYGEKNWKAIAEQVDGRNHMQCLQRWSMALNPIIKKGHWTASEDMQLMQALEAARQKGNVLTNWSDIAKSIPGRTSKQTYERWTNHLDPTITKVPFSFDEDELIRLLQAAHGNKWASIARHLPGRPMEAVKTRWRSLQRAAKKNAAFAAKQQQHMQQHMQQQQHMQHAFS
jgi:hypothetical protein